MRSADSSELLHRFAPPSGLTLSAPRDVRLTVAGRVLIVMAWLLSAGAITAGVLLYRETVRQADARNAIETRGTTAQAFVDRLWRESGDGKPAFAAFHFFADGVRISGETRMQLGVWRQLREGSTLSIRYLPEDPRRWTIFGGRDGDLPMPVPYFVSSALGFLALMCGLAVRRQRWLLMEGRAAPARITQVRKHKGSHGSHSDMQYEFPLLGGGVATGKARASRGAAIGGTICVLYDPDRPARNEPYPFALVAPVGPDF
jgi:hypothetical protein